MTKEFNSVRLEHPRDTEANWIYHNPILRNGEIIFVDMTNGSIYIKVGDGVSRYNALPFVTFGSSGSGSEGGLTELDVRNIIQEYTSIINENYENLKEEVSLNSLVLSELGMKYTVDIEDTYDERVTAGGGNVLDNSKAKIRKVIGNTERVADPDTGEMVLKSSTFGGVRMSPMNLFDISQIEESANIAVKNNSIIYTNSEQAYSGTDKTLIELFPYIEVGKTYTFSAVKDYDTTLAPTGPVGRIAIVSPAFTTLVPYGIGLTKNVLTITEEILSSQVYLYGDVKTPVTFSEIMCIEGDYSNTELPKYRQFSEIKDFVFSKTETPLGTTIDFENKIISQEFVSYTFSGSENIEYQSSTTVVERWMYYPTGDMTMLSGNGHKGVCSKYENTNSWSPSTPNLVKFGQVNSGIYFFLPLGQTLETVRDLLRGETIRFPLKTPTSTPFTAEQEAVGNEYIAKTLGKEEILDNDGKQYGVSNTLIQNYVFAKEGV